MVMQTKLLVVTVVVVSPLYWSSYEKKKKWPVEFLMIIVIRCCTLKVLLKCLRQQIHGIIFSKKPLI